ncbi:hypothetical protein YPPY12_2029, partial [Yersinia pestis PY-12]
MAGFP